MTGILVFDIVQERAAAVVSDGHISENKAGQFLRSVAVMLSEPRYRFQHQVVSGLCDLLIVSDLLDEIKHCPERSLSPK